MGYQGLTLLVKWHSYWMAMLSKVKLLFSVQFSSWALWLQLDWMHSVTSVHANKFTQFFILDISKGCKIAVQLSSVSIGVKRKCGQVLWPPLIPDQQLLKPCLRLCEGVWFWESMWTDNFWSVWGCIQNHLSTQCSLEWAQFFSRGIKREPFNSNFSCNCVETLRF